MSEVVRCFFCGAFIQKEDRFCWACGRELSLPTAQAGPAARELEEQLDREEWLKLRQAYLFQSRGNVAGAERAVREVLQAKPHHVPSLTLLAELQRAKGDLVGAVQSAQLAADVAAAEGAAPPGALRVAREERAHIQEQVIRDVSRLGEPSTPLDLLVSFGSAWYRSGWFYLVLAAAGLGTLALTVLLALHGSAVAFLWLAGCLAAAGWTYHDAELSQRLGLLWGPLVLFLGPFGLTIYFLSRR